MTGSQPKGRKFMLLLALCFLIGATSTGHLLAGIQFPELAHLLFTPGAIAAGLVCAVFTTSNVLLRWSRWHFLIRRFTPHLITRDSLAVYLATLPAIISPFFLAELGRVFLIRRRFAAPASHLVRVWFAERFLDFCAVGGMLVCALAFRGEPLGLPGFSLDITWTGAALALGILFALVLGVFRLVLRTQSASNVLVIGVSSLCLTTVAWLLPIVALHLTLVLLGAPSGPSLSVKAFGEGTLFGGLTGLPLGVYVTGSTMIHSLTSAGVPEQVGVIGVLVYRTGTAWFAVLLGLVSLVVFRKRIFAMIRGSEEAHFDEIASEYEGEIPEHVRQRLLFKKVEMMKRTLASYGIEPGAKGLDLGCGQGWYLAEMRQRGFSVDGTDYSSGQLERAKVHLESQGLEPGTLVQADAQALPFEECTYDFVYSINAIHHILAEGAQQRTMDEIVRVLKPGGVFLLNEMNTYNPVFRWYMGYLFPLLKKIDEGNEEWILPTELPPTAGAHWDTARIEYFTFLPDFIPRVILQALAGFEKMLEESRFRRLSAHYQACLVKLAPSEEPRG